MNALAGWLLVLVGFLSGACLGLGFHREGFLGGYASFRRRIVRLGHIACVALGMLNVLFAVAVPETRRFHGAASMLLVAGGVAMPLVCFLAGWRQGFRALFVLPVACLVAAVALVLAGLLGASPLGASS
jgi:hypothetical protein